MNDLSNPALVRRMELILAEASATFFEGTDPKRSSVEVARFGSAVGVVDYSPAGRLNRVAGLGIGELATEATIDAMVERYGGAGIKTFFVWVTPNAQPVKLPAMLEARGFKHDRSAAKIARSTREPATIETDLRIEPAGAQDKDAVAEVLSAGFGMSIERGRVVADSVDRDDWRWYVAWDGDTPAGTGGLYIRDGVGWLGYGATAPAYRRRGGQGAIIARRVAEAGALGIDWVTSETAEDTPDTPISSYHNMIRNGFELIYVMKGYAYGV
ncbi:MAG TPA: GNAT family N-acetyltransferase [Dehalococcoidia bacterium]|nr:GNAT family N-acetyltransferase [Dehalococcoidia bacterium]